MRYSSFNWTVRGKRGWIIGPFFDRTLTITFERSDPEGDQFLADERHIDDVAEAFGWNDGRVELPRRHDLAPRRWRLPSGEIIGNARNEEALDLLRNDPAEYSRRTRRDTP